MDFWFPEIFWGMGAVGLGLAAFVIYCEEKEAKEDDEIKWHWMK